MITLKRKVKTNAYIAIAQIGVPSQREEILAVLTLAEENNGHISPEDVNVKLLGRPAGSPQGQRLLTIIESYGALETENRWATDNFVLTAAGKENLQNKQVMIPEEGAYTFYTTSDSLFKESILRIEKSNYVEREESQNAFGNKKQEDTRSNVETIAKPSYLEKYEHGYLLAQAANSNSSVQINSISDKVTPSFKSIDIFVTLELEPNRPTVFKVQPSRTSPSSKEVYAETNFDRDYTQVLEALTRKHGALDLSMNEPTLRVNWTQVSQQEVESMTKEISINAPEMFEFGTFENVNVRLPIFPESFNDAKLWANHLLKNGVKRYLTQAEYPELRKEIANKFSCRFDSEELEASIIEFDELVDLVTQEKIAGNDTSRYWYLIAPQDVSYKR
jgi:hypothetical protein